MAFNKDSWLEFHQLFDVWASDKLPHPPRESSYIPILPDQQLGRDVGEDHLEHLSGARIESLEVDAQMQQTVTAPRMDLRKLRLITGLR